jgi:hypothetical protein
MSARGNPNPNRIDNLTGKGKGRPKGVGNKVPGILKEAAIIAAQKAGEKMGGRRSVAAYLAWVAENEPQAFMQFLGKLIPQKVEGTGESGEHVVQFQFERVIVGATIDAQDERGAIPALEAEPIQGGLGRPGLGEIAFLRGDAD